MDWVPHRCQMGSLPKSNNLLWSDEAEEAIWCVSNRTPGFRSLVERIAGWAGLIGVTFLFCPGCWAQLSASSLSVRQAAHSQVEGHVVLSTSADSSEGELPTSISTAGAGRCNAQKQRHLSTAASDACVRDVSLGAQDRTLGCAHSI
jgi:hypothetical protein